MSVLLAPGWVQTDMSGAGAPTSVCESVQKMLRVIDRIAPADSGGFFDCCGARLAF